MAGLMLAVPGWLTCCHSTPPRPAPITPKLFIMVHILEGIGQEVTILEEVSGNHQVNKGALVVAEGLTRCMLTDQMRAGGYIL